MARTRYLELMASQLRDRGSRIFTSSSELRSRRAHLKAFHYHSFLFSLVFPHRAAAALRAISRRRFGVRLAARALPPTKPPLRAHSCRSAAVIDAALSFAKATAAGFFFVAILQLYTSLTSASIVRIPWLQ